MGLIIAAVQQARFLHPTPEEWDDACDEHLLVYTIPVFVDRLDGKPEGCYESNGSPPFRFYAGSYSGYNAWRAWLSRTQLGVEPGQVWNAYDDFTGRPFVELIHFADNEGAIGPGTSAKLAEDFRHHAPDAEQGDDPLHYLTLYHQFWHAFEIAADDGFVIFR